MSDGSFSDRARLAIAERSQGRCQWCARRPGTDVHHRLPRRMGGTSRVELGWPSNGVLLCRGCHAWVEAHPACARECGLLLSAGQDPKVEAVLLLLPYGRHWYFLDPDSSVSWAHDVEESVGLPDCHAA